MITDKMVKEKLNIPNSTFYERKKRVPREIELIKKGLFAEKYIKEELLNEKIKK